MAATDYAAVVQQLYISYFGRPADPYGQAAYEAQLDAMGAPTTLAELNAAAQSSPTSAVAKLINSVSASPEAVALYGTGTSIIEISKFVNAIYNNVLGRDADEGGNFWINAIVAGNLTKANAALAITMGALGNTSAQGLLDAKTVSNKLAVGTDFTTSLDTIAKINAYSGDVAAKVARDLLATVNNNTDLAAAHVLVVSTTTNLIPVVTVNTALATTVDAFVGTNANDVISATLGTGATLGSFDSIDGGAGKNTLNISNVTALSATDVTAVSGLTVKNIQTVNVQGTDVVTIDTTNWTGVTALNVLASKGTETITAAATTAVNVVDLLGNVTVKGGAAVNVATNGNIIAGGTSLVATISGAVAQATRTADVAAAAAAATAKTNADTAVTNLGNLDAAIAGAGTTLATITTATAAAVLSGEITVAQKTAIDAAADIAGATDVAHIAAARALVAPIATAAVAVATAAATTKTAADDVVTADTAAGNFNVTDTANTALTTATVTGNYSGNTVITDNSASSNTLTTVSLSNSGTAVLTGTALTNVTVANGSHNVTITNSTVGHTENVTVTGLTAGVIADGVAKTLVVNSTGSASSGVTLSAASATAVTLGGDKALAATLTAGLATAVTLTGAGGFTGSFSGVDAAAVITATASTGANSVAVAAGQSYLGGSGVDTVTIVAAPTKAISGGAGTADELVINVAAATFSSASGNTFITGFETLGLGSNATGTYDATGFTNLHSGTSAAAIAFNNVAAGTGLLIDGASTGGVTYTLKDATGTADSVNVTLKSSAGLAAGSVTLTGIETVKIATADTNSAVHVDTITLVDADAKSIVVTGNAGLNLSNAGSVAVTSFDASGVTAGAVTYTSANTTATAAVSIKGGAGNDVLTGSVAVDTILGGAGDDLINAGTGLDIVTGGAGADTFAFTANANGNIYTTVTDFTKGTGGDTLNLSGLDVAAISTVAALGAKIGLGATAAFADFLAAAATGHAAAATNAVVSWFQFGGDTYVVVDNTNVDVFTNGATGDQVVKLTGTIDLSTAAITGGLLTVA